jgi:hypothetical protein
MARTRARGIQGVSGTKVVRDPVSERLDAIRRYVRAYLAECEVNSALLRSQDHPTLEGCLKIVYHVGPTEKAAVKAAYAEEAAKRRTE